MTQQKTWRIGSLTGLFAAGLESILLICFEPDLTFPVFVQSTSFWFFSGLTIHFVHTGQFFMLRFIMFTVFLNFPWYFNLAVIPGKYEFLAPLIIMSIIFGSLVGLFNQFINNHLHHKKGKNMSITETVIFKIKSDLIEQAKSVRPAALSYIQKNYPGVISIEALHSADDSLIFMDLCRWENFDTAKQAAEKAMTDPNLKPYFETIESVVYMGHFSQSEEK